LIVTKTAIDIRTTPGLVNWRACNTVGVMGIINRAASREAEKLYHWETVEEVVKTVKVTHASPSCTKCQCPLLVEIVLCDH
jgi:hypothetical protein